MATVKLINRSMTVPLSSSFTVMKTVRFYTHKNFHYTRQHITMAHNIGYQLPRTHSPGK